MLQLLRGTERHVDSLRLEVLEGCSHWAQQVGGPARPAPLAGSNAGALLCCDARPQSWCAAAARDTPPPIVVPWHVSPADRLQDQPEKFNQLIREFLSTSTATDGAAAVSAPAGAGV